MRWDGPVLSDEGRIIGLYGIATCGADRGCSSGYPSQDIPAWLSGRPPRFNFGVAFRLFVWSELVGDALRGINQDGWA